MIRNFASQIASKSQIRNSYSFLKPNQCLEPDVLNPGSVRKPCVSPDLLLCTRTRLEGFQIGVPGVEDIGKRKKRRGVSD